MDKKIFGEIPLKSWRWLGVNEIKSSESVEEKNFEISDGETQKFSEINLSAGNIARKIKISVGKGAKVEFISADLGLGDYSADVEIDLRGDDSSADFDAVYFGNGERKLDFNYVIRQHGQKTSAKMRVRGALKDKSDKIFRGTLDFQRGSKGSTGKELEEVIILSSGTRNRSVPLMLAAEDDVDGHHAVSIGRLDEEKIFYLMSRGLDKAESEKLIVEAAFNPVLDKISDEKLREEIINTLQRRLER